MKYLIGLFAFLLMSAQGSLYEHVSIVKLIATPEKYCSKNVYVEGYFISDFEDLRLYLDANSANYRILDNGISISLDKSLLKKDIESFKNTYIRIEGVFVCSSIRSMPNTYRIEDAKNFQKINIVRP